MKPLTIQEIKRRQRTIVFGDPAIRPADQEHLHGHPADRSGLPVCGLKGDNFDGHDYLVDAARGGAMGAIVERPPVEPIPNFHVIGVMNARRALGLLATFVRSRCDRK